MLGLRNCSHDYCVSCMTPLLIAAGHHPQAISCNNQHIHNSCRQSLSTIGETFLERILREIAGTQQLLTRLLCVVSDTVADCCRPSSTGHQLHQPAHPQLMSALPHSSFHHSSSHLQDPGTLRQIIGPVRLCTLNFLTVARECVTVKVEAVEICFRKHTQNNIEKERAFTFVVFLSISLICVRFISHFDGEDVS